MRFFCLFLLSFLISTKGNSQQAPFELDSYIEFVPRNINNVEQRDADYLLFTDYDGDGDEDLLLLDREQPCGIYVKEDNLFTISTTLPTADYTEGMWTDINGDGEFEILLLEKKQSDFFLRQYHLVDGDYVLKDEFRMLGFKVESADLYTMKVALVDFDTDGDLDLISTAKYEWQTRTLVAKNENGIFSEQTQIEDINEVKSMLVDDFNGDDFEDILLVSADFGAGIIYSHSQNDFSINILDPNFEVPLTGSADFDNDGFPEVYSSSIYKIKEDGIEIYELDFFAPPHIELTFDYDNDGDLDWIGSKSIVRDYVLEFRLTWNNQSGDNPSELFYVPWPNLYFTDFNGDGYTDLVCRGGVYLNTQYVPNYPSILSTDDESNEIIYYFNPVSADRFILWNANAHVKKDIRMISLQGKVIKEDKLFGTSGKIDVADVIPGVYILQTVDASNKIVIK